MTPEAVRVIAVEAIRGMTGAPDIMDGDTSLVESMVELAYEAERAAGKPESDDTVEHPPHYTRHPSGIECIEVTEHMGFCLGNAVKYIWRADLKGSAIEDLRKAAWYIRREIEKREAANG